MLRLADELDVTKIVTNSGRESFLAAGSPYRSQWTSMTTGAVNCIKKIVVLCHGGSLIEKHCGGSLDRRAAAGLLHCQTGQGSRIAENTYIPIMCRLATGWPGTAASTGSLYSRWLIGPTSSFGHYGLGVEGDPHEHRFIKKRIVASLGFRLAEDASRTIEGYEAVHQSERDRL